MAQSSSILGGGGEGANILRCHPAGGGTMIHCRYPEQWQKAVTSAICGLPSLPPLCLKERRGGPQIGREPLATSSKYWKGRAPLVATLLILGGQAPLVVDSGTNQLPGVECSSQVLEELRTRLLAAA